MIENLLSAVKCPSRYLGSEINSIHKDPSKVKLRIALVFPDIYEVGMSHLGLQILYHLFNSMEEVYCERAFAPAPDMEALIRKKNIPWVSHETLTPLRSFDVVAFTLPSELNYTTVLNILALGRIPLRSEERGEGLPFILGGGACCLNPEPLAPFFDGIFLGEIEDSFLNLLRTLIHLRASKSCKEEWLNELSAIPGIYIPSMFQIEYSTDGRLQRVLALRAGYEKVVRQVVADFENAPFPARIVVPFTGAIHDRLNIEISRGCTQGCRFCHAGTIYRPVRERSVGKILEIADVCLKNSGYEEISLLSLSAGDYSQIDPLLSALVMRCEPDKVAISLPSLRAGTLSERAMRLIKSIRKTGFTIAIEAGTERLRKVINKDITDEAIIKMAESAFSLGWRGLKLYFMIGLPTEKQDDIDAIVSLARRLQRSGKGEITVSIATFIPKPHTPFQWDGQLGWKEADGILSYLRDRLRAKHIKIKWQEPRVSFIEGVLSRGDRRLSAVLERALSYGCRLDSWSEHFDFSAWMKAFEAEDVLPEFYLRERKRDELFPWEHIDSLATRDFLWMERERAFRGETTEDCFNGRCDNCGACDFKTILPVSAGEFRERRSERRITKQEARYRMRITKAGPMRHLSHLEYIRVMERAIRRAGLPFCFRKGYRPSPKMNFSPALPVGVESLAEYLDVMLALYIDSKEIEERLNDVLPDGISVVETREIPLRAPSLSSIISEMKYEVQFNINGLNLGIIQEKYSHLSEFPIFIQHKEKTVNAKIFVQAVRCENGCMKFNMKMNNSGSISPYLFVKTLVGLDDEAMGNVKITKVDVRFR